MSLWSWLWPFGRSKPKHTPETSLPGTVSDNWPYDFPVPSSDFDLAGMYRKPRSDRRPIEQSRIVPRRHGGVEVGDNSEDIADSAVTLITAIADTIPAPTPVPEPRHTPVETPHHSAPSHSHDSGQTYHHVDTSHVHVDSSPSFSDGGGSASTGC